MRVFSKMNLLYCCFTGIMVHAPLSLCSYVPALHDWKRLHDCG